VSGGRVLRELEALIAVRGRPAMCVSDNGTELTSMAILRWSQERRVEWHYIAPGKPQQKAFVPLRLPPIQQTRPRMILEYLGIADR
jgi:putative transposase